MPSDGYPDYHPILKIGSKCPEFLWDKIAKGKVVLPVRIRLIKSKGNMSKRKISLFIAMSLDGYIAKPNDDLSFLSLVEKEGEDYGYAEFTASIDTVIVGRKTYDYVLREIGSSHYDNGQRDVYVISRTERPKVGRTTFYSGSLKDLVEGLKSEDGKNIYCDGGAQIINELLHLDLIDEYMISVIPVLLGSGTRLFKDDRPEQLLELLSV